MGTQRSGIGRVGIIGGVSGTLLNGRVVAGRCATVQSRDLAMLHACRNAGLRMIYLISIYELLSGKRQCFLRASF